MKLYGIPNCDTVKKARAWLAEHDIAIEFHDFKKAGVTETLLRGWLAQTDWQTLLNRRGTTWRQLPDDIKAKTDNEAAAITLMLGKPSVIKRPVLEADGRVVVGFDPDTYSQIFRK